MTRAADQPVISKSRVAEHRERGFLVVHDVSSQDEIKGMLEGEPSFGPRVVPAPIRLSHPGALRESSICESQPVGRNCFFATDRQSAFPR